jgi:hypothetical protein
MMSPIIVTGAAIYGGAVLTAQVAASTVVLGRKAWDWYNNPERLQKRLQKLQARMAAAQPEAPPPATP